MEERSTDLFIDESHGLAISSLRNDEGERRTSHKIPSLMGSAGEPYSHESPTQRVKICRPSQPSRSIGLPMSRSTMGRFA